MATALVQVDEALKREADAVLAGSLPFEVGQDRPSEEELEERRDAVEFVRVNCELEGLTMSEEHTGRFWIAMHVEK